MAIEHTNSMDSQSSHFDFLQDLSWAHLKTAGRATLQPFQLTLLDSKDVLHCHEIIRVIPGKRLVAYGTWGNKPVVAKLFYAPDQALRHAKRERAGVQALLNASVLTPELYFSGESKDGHVQVLIFERIMNSQNLETIWQNRTSIKELLPLLNILVTELATQHVLGILQRDLHFKNFLVKAESVYTIDGGDLEIFDKPLTKSDSIENLGLFFSQFGVGTAQLQKMLFQIYVEARGWLIKKGDAESLNAAVNMWTKQRWEHYSKKIMRTCTAFVRQLTPRRLSVYDRDYESTAFLAFLKNPEAYFLAQDTEMLKAGRSSTVLKIKIDNKFFVLKRYNIKNAAHWLRRCLRMTRAASGWRLAQRLRLLGVATAKPVAFIETRVLGLRGKSYLLLEYIEGEDAGKFFSAEETPTSHFVAQQMMVLFENLARLRVTHGDLKMTNILIAGRKPMLIDLDGMCEHRTLLGFKRAFHHEITRFMANWRDNPTVYGMFELLIAEVYRRLGNKYATD